MILLIAIALLMVSVVFNVTITAKHKPCLLGHNYSDWTPWHTLSSRKKYDYYQDTDIKEVSFRRNRYCTRCAREQTYTIGHHNCVGNSCSHMDTYIVALDEKAQIRALEKELGI